MNYSMDFQAKKMISLGANTAVVYCKQLLQVLTAILKSCVFSDAGKR